MPASLAGSCCGTIALTSSGDLVAMGRAVGDGAFFFYVQEMAGPLTLGLFSAAEAAACTTMRALPSDWNRSHDTTHEAEAMILAARFGVPVPVIRHAQGPDLVMDRVDGTTMTADLVKTPDRAQERAATLPVCIASSTPSRHPPAAPWRLRQPSRTA